MNHGTDQRWRQGCRCKSCHSAHRTVLSTRHKMRKLRGESWYESNKMEWEPVRKHLQVLFELGYTHTMLSQESGVNFKSLNAFYYQKNKRTVSKETGQAILNIPLVPPKTSTKGKNPKDLVNGIGARRRIKALCVIGFNTSEVCKEIGLRPDALNKFLREPEESLVRVKTVDRIIKAFNNMILKPVPKGPWANRCRNRAQKKGWHNYLAWADIDDPMCEPEISEEQKFRKKDQIQSQVEDARFLQSLGLDEKDIAERMGMSAKIIRYRLRE